jgi:outer membrane lipoprotein SlyB
MSTRNNDKQPVREVVGIFFDVKHLEATIKDLRASGFEHDQLGLLASEFAVEKSLGELYTRTNKHHDVSHAPATAFVKNNSVGDTFRALEGGLFFTGTTVAMGAAVATGAIFGGALLAAVAGAVGVGAIGALISGIIHQSDAEYLEEQIDEGHLLLFVRVNDPAQEKLAVAILTRHSGYDARVHEVPAELVETSA